MKKSVFAILIIAGITLLSACSLPFAKSDSSFMDTINSLSDNVSGDDTADGGTSPDGLSSDGPESKYSKNPMSLIFFDDGYCTVKISKDIYNYCIDYGEYIDFADADGNSLMNANITTYSLNFGVTDNNGDYYSFCSRQDEPKEEANYMVYSFDAIDEYSQMPATYPSAEFLGRIVSYNYGNGVDNEFSMDYVDFINHYDYRMALIPEKMKEILYKTSDDNDNLIPTTDDFKIEYFNIPQIKKISGYTSGHDQYGNAIYFGFINDEDADLYMPCKFIKVTSYDETGNTVSVGERLSFECLEDAFYTPAAGDAILYFENYNGVNTIPEDYNPEELITYINDVALPSRASDIMITANLKRVDATLYYHEELGDNIGKRIFGLDDLYGIGLELVSSAGLASDGSIVSLSSTCGFSYTLSTRYVSRFLSCDKSYYYSLPGNHIPPYENGTGDTFANAYPAKTLDMGFLPYKEDVNYFVPLTDDYILYFEKATNSAEYNYFAVLESFDETGKMIQRVKRNYQSCIYKEDQDMENQSIIDNGAELLYNDDNYGYFDVLNMTEPEERYKIVALTNMVGVDERPYITVDNATNIYYRAFINIPGLTSSTTTFENDYTPEADLLWADGIEMMSEDYVIMRKTRTVAQGSSDGMYYDTEYPADRYIVTFFNETGHLCSTMGREIYVFENEADAKAYYDSVASYTPLMDPSISGRKVAVNYQNYDFNKYQCIASRVADASGEEEYYLSIPNLTDRQLQYFENSGYKLK